MRLPDKWVNYIVKELQGAYGQQFAGKFSKVDSGVDVGIENFKESLATRLGGFIDHHEALRYALDNLPDSHCPNVPEFHKLAQAAPRKKVTALTYTPSPADEEKAKAIIAKAAAEMKPKLSGGIDVHWATHPRTEMHLRLVFDAAKRDDRFQSCIEQMVSDGICTADGRLLKSYRDREFVKA
jgi:hypothetical protein